MFLSGSVVPIWFFPEWFQRISARLPFIYIIRLGETFELLKRMYDISDADYTRRMGVFHELLDNGTIPPIEVAGCRLRSADGSRLCLEFDHHKHDSVELLGKLARLMQINDFSIVDPDIEEVIATYYGAPPADRSNGLS